MDLDYTSASYVQRYDRNLSLMLNDQEAVKDRFAASGIIPLHNWTLSSSSSSSSSPSTYLDEPTAWSLSQFWTICFASGLLLVIVFGVIGNALVIYVSLHTSFDRNNRNSGTIDVYILHLSVADFFFLIFCVPFQGTVYILNDWPYGLTMCKIAYYCQYVTMYASVWTLTLMSIDRYVAIGHPLKSVKWRTIGRATRSSVAVWALAILLSSPWLFFYTTIPINNGATICYDYSITHADYRLSLILITFLISFLLPTTIIFCMALLVWVSMRTSALQRFTIRTAGGGAAGSGTGSGAASCSGTGTGTMDRDGVTGGSGSGGQLLLTRENTMIRSASTGARSGRYASETRRRRRVVWMVFTLSAWYMFCWLSHNVLLVWLNFDPNAVAWVDEHNWTYFILKIAGHMGTYVHAALNPILYSLAYEQFRRRLTRVLKKRSSAADARKESNQSNKQAGTGGGGGCGAATANCYFDQRLTTGAAICSSYVGEWTITKNSGGGGGGGGWSRRNDSDEVYRKSSRL